MYHTLSAPVSCQIEITTGCNNNCIHCYNYWRHDKKIKNSNMSRSALNKVVADIIESNVFHVTFTGGEPFLKKDILFDGIESLIKGGVVCDINSNLTLFTKNDAEKLISFGVGGVLTSISAPHEILHDYIMQSKGAFQATMNGIKVAQRAGLAVAASMVVTKLNINEVYATGAFLYSIGINQFYATKASPPVNSLDFSQYMLSQNELTGLLEQLRLLREELHITVGALECYPLCSYLNQEAYSFMSDRRCSAGVTTCSIGSDGSIRACSHDDVSYGNILHEGLMGAWRSMSSWRDGSLLPQVCRECDFFSRCSGGCRVDASYISGEKSCLEPYADPNNIKNVILRSAKFNIDLFDIKMALCVSNNLKYRDEGFCVLCAGYKNIASPATLSNATYKLIQFLTKKIFTLDDVIRYTGLSVDHAKALCNALLADEIFQPVERR